MNIPPKGEFGAFQGLFNPFGSVNFEHFEPDRKDIYEAALILDQEYRGSGVKLDEKNINEKIRKRLTARRLQNFALFLPIVENIIDVENPNYVRPPRRQFTIKDKPVGDKINDRLQKLYEEMDFNNEILYMSRQAAYMGTLLAFPAVDIDTKEMSLVKLTPADMTLNILADPNHPSQALEIRYDSITEDGERVENIWDLDNFTSITHTVSGEAKEEEPHQFNGMPLAILRYKTDSNRFWGPYDGGLLSLTQTRSLLLSDSIYRTQTSLIEFLVFMGFTPAQALAAAKTRGEGVVAAENAKDDSGKEIPGSKDIKYVSPEGLSPEKLLEQFENIFRLFLSARGHSHKNFDSSRMIQTAEAMQFANLALVETKESKRGALLTFEQALLERIVWANNKFKAGKKLPEGIQVILDWQPDKQVFNNATDKSNAYKFNLNNNIMTPPDIIRQENPELSKEEALVKYEENKKFNEENNVGFQQETDPNNLNPQDEEKDKDNATNS